MSDEVEYIKPEPYMCHGKQMMHEVVGDGDDEAEIYTCHYCSCTRDYKGDHIKNLY